MGLLDEEFLTVAEIAEMLKLNQQTVRNWIDDGYLPAIRAGRRVRVLRSDLKQLLEDGKTPSRPRGSSPAQKFWDGEPPPPPAARPENG
jgi:excisionase family DNA binding protein